MAEGKQHWVAIPAAIRGRAVNSVTRNVRRAQATCTPQSSILQS
jgi:hypothetical protein